MDMDVEILKRNIKLQGLCIGKLSNMEQKVFNYLTANVNNLNTYSSNKYRDCLFFGKSKNTIILHSNKRWKILYVDYSIYSHFELEFKMVDSVILELMEWWIGNLLNVTYSFSPFGPIKHFAAPTYHYKKNDTNKLKYECKNL